MIPDEITNFITKEIKDEIAKYKNQIDTLNAKIEKLNVEIKILKEGDNI